jgi:hypothetical protein
VEAISSQLSDRIQRTEPIARMATPLRIKPPHCSKTHGNGQLALPPVTTEEPIKHHRLTSPPGLRYRRRLDPAQHHATSITILTLVNIAALRDDRGAFHGFTMHDCAG